MCSIGVLGAKNAGRKPPLPPLSEELKRGCLAALPLSRSAKEAAKAAFAAETSANAPYRRAAKMLFGMRQCTFFSLSEIAPTRQSMATLASP